MKKVAIYARVSTTHQNTQLQLKELEHYIGLRGWLKVGVFEDTSTGTNTSRDGFKALIKAARSREFDIILIWKLDRLFRSLKDLVITVNEFEELGISLVSLKDQIDLTTSTGRLMVHLLGAFAQFEADLIKSRVQAGIEKARRDGKKLGRPRLHKENEIRAMRAKGYSYQKIQMKLGVSKGPLPSTELEKILSYVDEKNNGKQNSSFDDLSRANEFSDYFESKLIYITEEKSWYAYNGKIWEQVSNESIWQYCEEFYEYRKILLESSPSINDDLKRAELKRLRTKNQISSYVEISKSKLLVKTEQFNKQHSLLNVSNGVIDLKNKKLLGHDREYF